MFTKSQVKSFIYFFSIKISIKVKFNQTFGVVMGFNPGANLYVGSFGMKPENVEVPTFQTRNPTGTDVNWPSGKRWINTSNNSEYSLTSLTSIGGVLTANWTLLGGASSDVNTLSGDTGTAAPVAGNIQIKGTANQISTTGSNGQVLLALPSSITAPGSVTSTTTLTATLGNITATNGNLVLGTAGNKLSIATGTNASVGTSGALSTGTVTVATTAVTASSKIFLTRAVAGGTLGNLSVGTITAGTSFTITSDQALDTSTVNWLIIN